MREVVVQRVVRLLDHVLRWNGLTAGRAEGMRLEDEATLSVDFDSLPSTVFFVAEDSQQLSVFELEFPGPSILIAPKELSIGLGNFHKVMPGRFIAVRRREFI